MKEKFFIKLKLLKFKIKQKLGFDKKIFIIGRNKTGTTSIEKCLRDLGYLTGDQKKAEMFIDDYAKGYFDNILAYCDSAEVFQDAPFSWPGTYKKIFSKYPNAYYILLERDSSEEWYESLVRFHRKIINKGNPVTADDLKNFVYWRKGYLWQVAQVVYGVKESNVYDKDVYINNYEVYNKEVREFFGDSPNFLAIKLTEENVEEKLAKFLKKNKNQIKIPHLNKSK
ncbi:sulfotransferase [Alteromonas mediterranea]|uniref:Sulfotransferase domain-containing protein n=1 Tax=Alteromonas mediterranea (strain DSM 17117 / CIP 110805 / LMG 28347 / Deep ecotype) TaxID=1774373 RepID=T2DL28_ALTMD|nr:sulfotransferase [Alteromonas mediterranea]AGV54056.1 hypothetical protein MADE_000001022340 [Alteromonas mediterranea DE]CAH1207088.1 hypothetical protein ISS312_03772 [Alteromonas mediterranea]|tara:strand:+ start:35014 stop:35691 length:678 start_codon:yes stop_codon:yes gene_type:complete